MELPLIILTGTSSLSLNHALRPVGAHTAPLLFALVGSPAAVLQLQTLHELAGDVLDLAAEGALFGVLEAVVVLELGELKAHAAPQEVVGDLLLLAAAQVVAHALFEEAVLERRGVGGERFQGVCDV